MMDNRSYDASDDGEKRRKAEKKTSKSNRNIIIREKLLVDLVLGRVMRVGLCIVVENRLSLLTREQTLSVWCRHRRWRCA